MTEPLKDGFGPDVPERIADAIAKVWPSFRREAFLREALRGYADLELIARARDISSALHAHLPADYDEAIRILMASLGPRTASAQELGRHRSSTRRMSSSSPTMGMANGRRPWRCNTNSHSGSRRSSPSARFSPAELLLSGCARESELFSASSGRSRNLGSVSGVSQADNHEAPGPVSGKRYP